jgi:hypothetical protein
LERQLLAALDDRQREAWNELCGPPYTDRVLGRFRGQLAATATWDAAERAARDNDIWFLRGSWRETMRLLQSRRFREWLELDEAQQRAVEAQEAARDEFEALLPRVASLLTRQEYSNFIIAQKRSVSAHVYGDRLLKLLRPEQARRVHAVRLRLFGPSELLNTYHREFGISPDDRKRYSDYKSQQFADAAAALARQPVQTDDRYSNERQHQEFIAQLQPRHRKVWDQYMAEPVPPREVLLEAYRFLFDVSPNHAGLPAREPHVPKDPEARPARPAQPPAAAPRAPSATP